MLSQRREVGEWFGSLSRGVPRLVGPADRAKVAPGAGTFGGRRWQKTEFDGAIDDLERFKASAPIGIRQRYRMFGETSGGGRVEQPALAYRAVHDLLDGEPVDDWLGAFRHRR